MMCDETQVQETAKRKGRGVRILKWGSIAAVGIILLLFFGIPLFLSSSSGTEFLVGKINSSVDGQVQMDDFSIGWFKGIKLTGFSYADSAGNTSVKVRRIETRPKYTSLLGGKVKLGKTVIDQPRIHLKVPAEQDVATEAKASSAKSDAPPPVFPVNQIDLELINGSVTVELTADMPQTVSFTNITSKVQIADTGKSSSVDISMDVDDASKISAKGTATPSKKGWTLEDGDFNVQISKLQLASLKPLFALAGQEMDLSGELNADAAIKIGGNKVEQIKVDVSITDFIQGVGDQRVVFEEPVTINAIVSGTGKNDIQIKTFKIQSQFCNLDCSGTQESMDYAIDADLAQTQRVIGQFTDMVGLSVAGKLSVRGRVGMTDEAITVSGAGDLKRLQILKDTAKTPFTDMQLDFDCVLDNVKQQFRIDYANLTSTPGTIKVDDLIVPMSAQADKTLSMNAHVAMDLEKAWPFAQVFTEDLNDKNVSGQLDATVRVSTQGEQIHLVSENSKIQQLKISLLDSEPFVQDQVTLDADILMDTGEKTIDIRTLNLQGSRGETLINVTKGVVKKKVSNAQTQVSGQFEAEYDWQVLSAFASTYLPEGLFVKGKRKSAIHFESVYPTDNPEQMIANLNADGVVGFNSAEYLGMNFGPTELKANIQKGILNLQIPQTTVNEGTLQFTGSIDLSEELRFLRLTEPMQILDKIHLNDTMTQLLLLYTNPLFVDASETSGIASFSCAELAIPLSAEDMLQMTIRGGFQIDSLRMRAGDFMGQLLTLLQTRDTVIMTVHPTDFVLENNFLSYEDMQVDIDDNPLNFKGRIGLDKTLSMTVQLPWTTDFHSVKTDRPSQDRITVPIEGSLDHPEIDTTKFIEKQGKELIEQEIMKQLDRLFK